MRELGGKGHSGGYGHRGKCLSLLLQFFLFSLRHSPSTCRVGKEEEQRVFDRCAGLKTTPLFMSFLKGVSPGGVFERRKESGTGLII